MVLPSASSVFSVASEWFKPAGLAKFDRMSEERHLDLVYENEKVKTYCVRSKLGRSYA